MEDTQKENLRVKDLNARIASENNHFRREADAQMSETYELRKEGENQSGRNLDIGSQIRDLELRLKDKEDQMYSIRKDLDNHKFSNS